MAYTTIKKPSDYFNTKLYTGNGSTQSITGVGFQPDLTWVKSRTTAIDHFLTDAVRGANIKLSSNNTEAEVSQTNGLTSFDNDGFSVGDRANVNENSSNFASWNWLANGAGSANTDGSISSTVSANTTSGFSIVSYTGTGANATVGHGLGVAPKMIIVKKYNVTGSWGVYHNSLGNGNFLYLNDTNASASNSTLWNNTSPTSSVFNLGSSAISNSSSNSHIAYCFAEKQGFSKFGSYTGNGNADGTFIYTGFKPAFFVVKPYSTTGNWLCWDSKRSPINQIDGKYLELDASGAEVPTSGVVDLDFLSTGVKLRNTGGGFNGSGVSFIYMAFAEEPLVGDNPATAR